MTKTNCIFFFFLIIFNVESYALNVSVTPIVFQNEERAYLELYSRIMAESVQFSSEIDSPELLSSQIEMLVLLKSGADIVMAEKYNISSPASASPSDFWDMKRYGLDNGEHNLFIQFVDLNNTIDTFEFTQKINVNFIKDEFQHSDVLLISEIEAQKKELSFEKVGFYFEPLCFNLYNADQNRMLFYTELYNTNKIPDDCYLQYTIHKSIDDFYDRENVIKKGYKKLKSQAIEPLLFDFDISELLSGNYLLQIQINNKEKKNLYSYDQYFSVIHPGADYNARYSGDKKFETSFVKSMDNTELDYALKAIYPRVGNHMTESLNYIIASKETKVKRMFLYSFWSGFNPDNPKAVYNKYMEVAKAIDLRYINNVGHGFETDRGHIFLKYGRPDEMVVVEDEPSAPPYEIWIYNELRETRQTRVKFLFYNPSLVANDFRLLHSTCRGERNNPRWEVDLYADDFSSPTDNYIDGRTVQDNYNRNARRIFSDN